MSEAVNDFLKMGQDASAIIAKLEQMGDCTEQELAEAEAILDAMEEDVKRTIEVVK